MFSAYLLNKCGNPNSMIAESRKSKSKNARKVRRRWKLLFISGAINTIIDMIFPGKKIPNCYDIGQSDWGDYTNNFYITLILNPLVLLTKNPQTSKDC